MSDVYSFTRKPFYSNDTKLQDDYGSVKYSDILELPHNMNGFFDYDEAKEYAQKTNKPMLLDFTGHGCVNCRDIEARVWPDEKVRDIINNKYVLVSLYVDDKKELPEYEQLDVKRTSGIGTRKLENYGHKWAHFQASYFGVNSQPFYLIMDPNTYQILNDIYDKGSRTFLNLKNYKNVPAGDKSPNHEFGQSVKCHIDYPIR